MFGFSKRKTKGEKLILKIDGMHCTSCSMNIDGELEDMEGVSEATTNYAKSTSEVIYDSNVISINQIEKVITQLGYMVKHNSY